MSDIKPITGKTEIVRLENLHIRYIPVVTPLDIWNNDMSIANSPHVELYKAMLTYGFRWSELMHTRYVQERMRRFKIGLRRWTEEHVMAHLHVRYAILKSLKKHGYESKRHGKKPIVVLKQPFWHTRFGCNEPFLKGMEVWDGGGRTTALYALGKKVAPVVFYEDKLPGSGDKGKFENKLRMVSGVWE